MKRLLTILTIMTATSAMAQNGKATTVKTTFSRQTSVSNNIKADASIIWALLTNAADMGRWNSTIVSLDGEIKPGGKIRLKSKLDPKRTFKLKVKEFEKDKKLVWGDSQGSRIYTLQPTEGGLTTFTMVEKIGGFMFPMYSKYIPPFDNSFEQFAADLKKEAETIMSAR